MQICSAIVEKRAYAQNMGQICVLFYMNRRKNTQCERDSYFIFFYKVYITIVIKLVTFLFYIYVKAISITNLWIKISPHFLTF